MLCNKLVNKLLLMERNKKLKFSSKIVGRKTVREKEDS